MNRKKIVATLATAALATAGFVGFLTSTSESAEATDRTPCVKYINGVPIRTCAIITPSPTPSPTTLPGVWDASYQHSRTWTCVSKLPNGVYLKRGCFTYHRPIPRWER